MIGKKILVTNLSEAATQLGGPKCREQLVYSIRFPHWDGVQTHLASSSAATRQ